MIILYHLSEDKVTRYNELKRRIGTISFKTLSAMLKELEADGLINRTAYPQIPPKVEYTLSDRGISLIPVLNTICDWGKHNRPLMAAPESGKEDKRFHPDNARSKNI